MSKMAGRNSHVQDSTVAERRLRPIYEWLDSGNPKKALQETEKVLRKTPALQCAKALKAMSLLQLGREAECAAQLASLAAERPSDVSTLQTMSICYRDLGQLDKVCLLYSAALRAEPQSEELHTQLFMAHVRCFDYKLQQQAALALYRLKPKNPYYFWAVMSLVLQATRGPAAADPAQRQLLLAVAERMVEKLIQEGKLEAEQEVQLYLMVLELQGKYSEALRVTEGSLGGKVEGNRLGYLVKLAKWQEVSWLCAEMLQANMDRWDIWNHYLTSIFNLSANTTQHTSPSPSTPDPEPSLSTDDHIERAHEFICSLIENISDNVFNSSSSYQLRGPYLARFELYKRLKTIGKDPTVILGDIFELFVEYFRIFGHKSCCVSDLRIYLHLLNADRRIELATRLLKDVGISSTTLPTTEKQMQRHICSLQLNRLCGNHTNLNIEYTKALVAALSLHYENGARVFGGGKLPTDQGPADAYALLAAHTLFDLSQRLASSTPLVAALVLLETLLKTSPNNFHAKLLCVRLYHLLGGAEGAHQWYESLDAKYLQMDSLGFVHCARVYPAGVLSLTQSMFDATLKFFSTNYRDSIDHLTFSYKFGSFLKLEEFMDFRERLNNSLHYTLTAIDRMLLEVILCSNLKTLENIDASPKNNNISWGSLRDNNDYSVYVSWDPQRIQPDANTPAHALFEHDKDLTRIRAGILCCISTALDFIKPTSENKNQTAKTLQDVYADWLTQYKQIQARHSCAPASTCQLSQPISSRLHKQLTMPYRLLLARLVKLVLCCYGNSQEASQNGEGLVNDEEVKDEDLSVRFTELVDQVEEVVKQQNESEDCLFTRRESMEYVVNTIELISISTVLCAISHSLLQPGAAAAGRRARRRPPAAPASPGLRAELALYAGALHAGCARLDACLARWALAAPLADRLAALAVGDAQDAVWRLLRAGHARAQAELRAALHSKLKMLAAMVC